jgi:hypothetical protein
VGSNPIASNDLETRTANFHRLANAKHAGRLKLNGNWGYNGYRDVHGGRALQLTSSNLDECHHGDRYNSWVTIHEIAGLWPTSSDELKICHVMGYDPQEWSFMWRHRLRPLRIRHFLWGVGGRFHVATP